MEIKSINPEYKISSKCAGALVDGSYNNCLNCREICDINKKVRIYQDDAWAYITKEIRNEQKNIATKVS